MRNTQGQLLTNPADSIRRAGRTTTAAASLAILMTTLAGCGSSDGASENTDATATTTASAGTDDVATTEAGTTDAPTDSGETYGLDGTAFVTADGLGRMVISNGWTKMDAPAQAGADAALWQIAEGEPGATPNVNILSQQIGPMDLDGYMELSRGQLEQIDFTVVDSGTETGANGQELGFMEFTGEYNAGQPIHQISYVNISDGVAALVTMTAGEDTYAGLIEDARPFLQTVEVVK